MTSLADDVVAIQNTKALYCTTVDRITDDKAGVAEDFGRIFLPDVVAEYGAGPVPGADAVTDFLSNALVANSLWRIHMLHTPLIKINGDTATGDWTVMVYLQRPGDSQMEMVLGRYSDTFRRTADGWRIARVRFVQQA